MAPTSNEIAIVGMAALYAKAANLASYWQNIVNKVDAIQEAPDRWARSYVDLTSTESNRIYNRRGGFLLDLAEFNPLEFGIMPNSVDGGEPEQFLALKIARDALIDAGYRERPFNREKAGVILGRGVYLNRGNTNYMQHGVVIDQTLELLQQICPTLPEETWEKLREGLRGSLPPFGAQNIASLVPNVMAGRIANRLDLMGPNYVVDAACASSLIAVELAVQELQSGRCDLVIAGGVNATIPPPCCMMFCVIGALSHAGIYPFARQAEGTLLGEGVGMVVLKRLADAQKDGDRIYAVLKGVGTASDGKSLGLLSPRLDGEILALERAYERAGVEPKTVGLVEAHGTAIPLGDRTEIAALSALFGDRQRMLPNCGLGSVKSMIGHCLPAAGMAGLLKTALALYHKILPPTLCDTVNPELGLERTPFYINSETRPWIHGDSSIPRRAGVNAFGFGGINSHAILEEYPEERSPNSPNLHRDWPVELCVFAAGSRTALLTDIERLQKVLQQTTDLQLVDLAYTLSQRCLAGECRLAVLAKDPRDLLAKLEIAGKKVSDSKARRWQMHSGIYYAEYAKPSKIAFLFPGEGGQYPNMLADLCLHFPVVRQWFDLLDESFAPDRDYPPSAIIFPPPTALAPETQEHLAAQLYSQELAVELCFAAGRALYDLLGKFGLRADVILGHSAGETIALSVAGVFQSIGEREGYITFSRQMNQVYQEIRDQIDALTGTLLTVGGLEESVLQERIANAPFPIHLAMDNCPNQVVLFSQNTNEQDLAALVEHFQEVGGICMRLPYGRAHHTPLNTPVRDTLLAFYKTLPMGAPLIPLYSCATGAAFPTEPNAVRALAAEQWISRVRFRETINRLYAEGVDTFIEIGPKGILTGFVADILKGREHLALATDRHRRSGLEQLQHLLGRLFVHQISLQLAPLYELRQPLALALDALPVSSSKQPRSPQIALDLPIIELEPELIQLIKTQLREATLRSLSPTGQLSIPLAPVPFQEAHFPLLGEILEQTATRLRARRLFQIERDIFLEDHSLGGQVSFLDPKRFALAVIPFTFSMEMMAEAAVYLTGRSLKVIGLYNLRGYRWLTLDHGEIAVEVVAEADEADDVRVQLFQTASNHFTGRQLVFEGVVGLAETYPAPPPPLTVEPDLAFASGWPDDDLYHFGMFHGPRLQGVTHINCWGEQAIEANLVVLGIDCFFSHLPNPTFQIDAGLLDSVGQLVWYWATERLQKCNFYVFPYSCDAINFYAPSAPVGTAILTRGNLHFTSDKLTESNFDLVAPTGQIVVQFSQWKDRYFDVPINYYECEINPRAAYLSSPWLQAESGLFLRCIGLFTDGFFDTSYEIWTRILAHWTLSPREREIWYDLPKQDSQHLYWLLERVVAKDGVRQWAEQTLNLLVAPTDIEIVQNESGRFFAVCPDLQAVADIPSIVVSRDRTQVVAALEMPSYRMGLSFQSLTVSDNHLARQFEWTQWEREWLTNSGYDVDATTTKIVFWSAKVAATMALQPLASAPEHWQIKDYLDREQLVTAVWEGNYCQIALVFHDEMVLAIGYQKKF